jgi:hypothetical protein
MLDKKDIPLLRHKYIWELQAESKKRMFGENPMTKSPWSALKPAPGIAPRLSPLAQGRALALKYYGF